MRTRAPYNPFEYDRRPTRRLESKWWEIEEDDPSTAFKTLSRFRRENPDLKDVPATEMAWGYIWTEDGQPLDMSLSAEARTETRERAVRTVVVFCQTQEKIAYSQALVWPPDIVCDAILAEESARPSMSEVADG